MAYLIDDLVVMASRTNAYVTDPSNSDKMGKWVISRPLPGSFWDRLRDAWLVLTGKADAVTYFGQ